MRRTWETTTSTRAHSQLFIQREHLWLRNFCSPEAHNCGPAHSESFPDTKTSSIGYEAHFCITTAYLVMKNSCASVLQRLCTALVLLRVWQTIKGDSASVNAHCLFRTKQLQHWQRQTQVLQKSNVATSVVNTDSNPLPAVILLYNIWIITSSSCAT